MSFRYAVEYLRGRSPTPLSLSMPLAESPYPKKRVEAFLKGLLPDNADVRRRWAGHFGLRDGDTFGLVAAIGSDAAGGAVYLSADGEGYAPPTGSLETVTDTEIAERLSRLRVDSTAWLDDDEHWSLAGAQSKFNCGEHRADGPFRTAPSTPPTSSSPGSPSSVGKRSRSTRPCARLGTSVSTWPTPKPGVRRPARHRRDPVRPPPAWRAPGPGAPGGLLPGLQSRPVAQVRGRPRPECPEDRRRSAGDHGRRLGGAVRSGSHRELSARGSRRPRQELLCAAHRPVGAAGTLYDVSSGLAAVRDGVLRFPRSAMSIGGARAFGELDMRSWDKFAG
jgi:serine/threonine-protein kinase HipA